MTKITEAQWIDNMVNTIRISKYSVESTIAFYSNHTHESTRISKKWYRVRRPYRDQCSTYFRLTDDEVRDMIVPRII